MKVQKISFENKFVMLGRIYWKSKKYFQGWIYVKIVCEFS